MKKEKLIIELEDILANENMLKLNELIKTLHIELKEETSLKTNKKDKINAIKKIQKTNIKSARPQLVGYNINEDNKIEITDSYIAFILNMCDMPIEKQNGNYKYPNIKNLINDFDSNQEVELDLGDILYKYKLINKENDSTSVYIFNSKDYTCKVDLNRVKSVIDILGKNIRCSLNGNNRLITFINNENEIGVVCPIRCDN